jgi:hypothetical protein
MKKTLMLILIVILLFLFLLNHSFHCMIFTMYCIICFQLFWGKIVLNKVSIYHWCHLIVALLTISTGSCTLHLIDNILGMLCLKPLLQKYLRSSSRTNWAFLNIYISYNNGFFSLLCKLFSLLYYRQDFY